MARGVNKVIIVGNLGEDPTTRYMPSGGAVTNISVATSEKWKDKNTGQPVEKTEWHRIIFFNRLAEIAGEYLKKGSKVYIEGSLRTRKWTDQQGVDRYTTEIVASEMQMLDSRGNEPTSNNQGGQYNQQRTPQEPAPRERGNASSPPHTYAPGANQQPRHQEPMPNYGGGGFDDFDDDIPF
tara:strand:+ start:1004 stop:1546 length:543 start_codon:yes stop_codon:yes gene_type:complete